MPIASMSLPIAYEEIAAVVLSRRHSVSIKGISSASSPFSDLYISFKNDSIIIYRLSGTVHPITACLQNRVKAP